MEHDRERAASQGDAVVHIFVTAFAVISAEWCESDQLHASMR